MNNERLSHNELFAYAQNIIVHAPKFREFAEAMMDFAGGATDVVFYIYDELRDINLPVEIKLDASEEVDQYTLADLKRWYKAFQKEKEKKFEDEKQSVKENIDELQYLIEEYRSSERFSKMLEFVGNAKCLAAYNAMLVYVQKPGATFVFTLKKWNEKFNRQLKPNAQRLVTLVPFGPVQLMFDYDDTEPIPGKQDLFGEKEIMEEWNSILTDTRGCVKPSLLDNLIENLPNYGIRYDANFVASSSYGGYLMETEKHTVTIRYRKVDILEPRARFVLSVNRNLTEAARFHTICHELGHLFCHHLFYNTKEMRILSHEGREFEAETVAWLVCKRHGITNPSEKYLALYSKNGKIPVCSLDAIMKAVVEIEKMLKGMVSVRDTLWYHNDGDYKREINAAIARQRKERRS